MSAAPSLPPQNPVRPVRQVRPISPMKTNTITITDPTPPTGGLTLITSEDGTQAHVPVEVSWGRARTLWASAQRGAEDLIELAAVLIELRREFFAPGTNSPTSWHKASSEAGRGRSTEKPTLFTPSEKGWQQVVRDELGISHQTALRMMERGAAVQRLKAIAEGEDVSYQDGRGVVRVVEATPEAIEMAKEILPATLAGAVAAPRAWAGVCGEGTRREAGARRAAPDYCAVMVRALRSLRNASETAWSHLTPRERAEVEEVWEQVRQTLPKTWGAQP